MTSSDGSCGLMLLAASPPRSAIAFRIAARSTIAGTPVKSWCSTRPGVNEISCDGSADATQPATASTSARRDRDAVLVAEDVLEQDPQRVREPVDVEALLERLEAEDLDARARRPRGVPRAPKLSGCGHLPRFKQLRPAQPLDAALGERRLARVEVPHDRAAYGFPTRRA